MNGVEWGIDSSVFILIQGTNRQQLKRAGARVKVSKRRFFKSHVAEMGTRDALGAEGLHEFKGGQDRFTEEKCYIYSNHVCLRKTDLQMLEDGRIWGEQIIGVSSVLPAAARGRILRKVDLCFDLIQLFYVLVRHILFFFLIVILSHCFLFWLLCYLTLQLFLLFPTALRDGNYYMSRWYLAQLGSDWYDHRVLSEYKHY